MNIVTCDRAKAKRGLIIIPSVILAIYLLTACSPGYVLRAAYEQGKILARRQPIDEVIKSPQTSQDDRFKLEMVLDARRFAKEIGLDPGRSFTKFSRVDRDVLAWVLLGSKPDSFSLYSWWFPIVGSVPYKGFFERENALQAAKELENRGYETWVRGTQAISTLGWFNDPLLSTTLKNDPVSIADTVIHESVHSTIWIPDQVEFNESLANFVGMEGAVQFFRWRLARCSNEDTDCITVNNDLIQKSVAAEKSEQALAATICSLHEELKSLYSSSLQRDEKLVRRQEIFGRLVGPLKEKYPGLKVLKQVNNAEIMQLKLYMTGQQQFSEALSYCSEQVPCLMSLMRELKSGLKKKIDPFKLLSELLSARKKEGRADSA